MEEASEYTSATGIGGSTEPLATEQTPPAAVLDGERIAVDAVEGLELALEVGGPDGVGCVEGRGGPTGMRRFAPLLVPVDEALKHEVLVQGLWSGQRPVGMKCRESTEDLACPPPGSLPTKLEGSLEDHGVRRMRTDIGPMRSIEQAVGPLRAHIARATCSRLDGSHRSVCRARHARTGRLVSQGQIVCVGSRDQSPSMASARSQFVRNSRHVTGRDCHPSGVCIVLPIRGGRTRTPSNKRGSSGIGVGWIG